MDIFKKQSGEKLDYDRGFTDWLPEGDTITTVEVVLDVVGELVIEAFQFTGQVVKVWLTGGVNGSTYKITVTAATLGGRIKEDEFRLRIKDL